MTRCEDFPCCGHPAAEGCGDRPEYHGEYWSKKFASMDPDEMEDYEYRMEMQSEYDQQY